LFFYAYRDNQALNDPNPDREGYFGVVRNNYTHKPAYQALKHIILHG